MPDPVIQVANLTKFYGRQRGVLDLDLAIEPGEVFGFLGPNGAGKTTTIRLILDFIRPTRGSVAVFGLESHRAGRAIRRRVGYLPGDLRLYESLSGRELVDYFGRLRGHPAGERAAAIARRLDCDLAREIKHLSSGNRQKVGLVQAFMSDPDLLILDEPTNGLDPLVQQTFYELVTEARARGATVFLSSHVLPEVERVCDRIGIIRGGRLVAVESIAALRARAMRRLEVEFCGDIPGDEFDLVPGVGDVSVGDRMLRCSVVGPMDPILKAVNRYEVRVLTSSEPTLEEVFLAYYGDRASDAA